MVELSPRKAGAGVGDRGVSDARRVGVNVASSAAIRHESVRPIERLQTLLDLAGIDRQRARDHGRIEERQGTSVKRVTCAGWTIRK